MTDHFNLELEGRLISSMMKSPMDVQAAVSDGLVPESFYSPQHVQIFRGMMRCAAEGQDPDAVGIWRAANSLSGDKPSLAEIAQLEFLESTSLRRSPFTQDILALWRQRKLIMSLRQATEEAVAPADNWMDLWERVSPALTAAVEVSQTVTSRDTNAMLAGAKRLLQEPEAGTTRGPFPMWDKLSNPLRAGQLVVLAGRPGTGKTAMALQYAAAGLADSRHATIFSLEMDGDSLLHRMAHQRARSTHSGAVAAALDELPTKRLHIFEAQTHSSLDSIEAKARMLAKTVPLGAMVIDYLQLIRPPKEAGRENREQQVSAMTRRLKLLTSDLGCPLILLSQLNRESEKENRKPRLSDLRESGAIEQDADAVWFLWEDTTAAPQYAAGSDRATVHLIQAKRRNAQPNIFCKLSFHRPTTCFTPIQSAEG